MIIKQLLKEDNINYKKQSLFIGFPTCTWKCEREANCKGMCQNMLLAKAPDIIVTYQEIVNVFEESPLNEAIVCGGLEPFDSWDELLGFIKEFRKNFQADIVIYTGYTEKELNDKIEIILNQNIKNIIIKFGRYRPNQEKHYDDILGVMLASDNQYAKRIC